MTEHALLVALVALAALGAFGALGTDTSEKVACAAAAIGDASPCAARAAPPGASTDAPPPTSYEERARAVSRVIESSFDALAGGGEAITIDSLRAALSSSDAEVRDAAAFLLENDSLRFALDVGNGDGQIDGEISRDDVGVFADALAREDIGELLADTAGGEGGQDDHISDDDLRALIADGAVSEDIRAWARDALESGRYHEEGGCGWNPICHADHAASSAWDAGTEIAGYGYHVGEGFVGAGVQTVTGLYAIGEQVVTDPLGSARAIGGAIRHPSRIAHAGKLMAAAMWEDVKAAASGDPEAIGRLGFDVLTTVATGGTATAATKASRLIALVRKAHKADEAVPDTDVAATVARARDEQLAREIERNEQRLGHNERGLDGDGFVDDRPLHAYEKELVGFYDALRHLEPEDSWIDMGAGRALPMRTIMKRWNAPHMTALAREWPGAPDDLARLVTEGEGRFTPLYGKMLEDYPVASLGRHELVTDFYGPFSYSTHVDDVVRTYAEITNEGGHVQLLFMDTGIDLGAPQGALDWLRECRGLEVVDSRAKGPYQSVDLVRTRDPIDIPPLELRDFRATTPSYRAYDRVAP